jgi:hypothetical protein
MASVCLKMKRGKKTLIKGIICPISEMEIRLEEPTDFEG